MLKKFSIKYIRLLLFIIIIFAFVASYILYQEDNHAGSISQLILAINFISLNLYFTYEVNKYPLKIHKLIEKNINDNSQKSYLSLIIFLSLILIIGAYFSFRSIYRLDYLSKENYIFQFVWVILLTLNLSLWERRKKFIIAEN